MRVRSNGGIIGPQNNKAKFVYAGDAGLLTSITAVYICNSSYDNLDETVISTSGGYIRLIGVGFSSGYSLYVNGVYISSTQLVSSNEITAVIPANGNGTYSLTLFNSSGSGAIWAAGLTFSGFPSWTTGTYSNSGTSVSVQLLATGDAPLTYSLQAGSTLPSGVTLSSSGLLSGTVSVSVNTVYTFTVLVDDAQNQTTQQAITLTVVIGDLYFNNTVLALHGDGPSVPATIEILVVGGGGPAMQVYGNPAGIRDSGGGGGGGVIYNASLGITSGNVYTLSIGVGGVSGNTAVNGANSAWNSTFIAAGGGGGGRVSVAANTGGSGGGGGNFSSSAGSSNQNTYSGWTVYGNAGGAGIDTGPAWGTGGGGGAGAVGTAGSTSTGGTGGIGISNSITGVATYYAGGGGGGAANGAIAAGGLGGGGASANSATGVSGTPNTGGGGGGVGNFTGALYSGGAGGSGVSIIAYPSTFNDLTVSSGLTYSMSTATRSGYKVYTFTAGTGTISIASSNNNTFLDSSNNSYVVTRAGTPTQGTFTPFSQTGWSGYFPGSSYLSLSTTAANFTTNNFTVEGWFNFTTNSIGYQPLLSNTGSADGQGWTFITETTNLINVYMSSGSAWAYNIATSYLPALNVWIHFALVRNGTTLTLYANGVSIGSTTISTLPSPTNGAYIGYYPYFPGGARSFTGQISNVRYVNGTAVYTANFIPPTAPLTAITNTSLLTLQSNYFKDNSSNNFAITATGTPSIQAFSPFAPANTYTTSLVGGSAYFNGSVDYLTVPILPALGANNYTIECWIYPIVTTNQDIIELRGFAGNPSTNPRIQFGSSANTNRITFGYGVSDNVIVSTSNVAANNWYHVAAVRVATTATLYINGVSQGTAADSTTYTSSNACFGIYTTGVAAYKGYISNIRLVNGTAIYTTAFTPPTAPLTAVANTILLLNGTNAAIYDSTAKNDLITIGSAKTSNTQSKFGVTSMFFNGTTDYLTAVDTPNLQLGTGDFTIEAWVYITTAGIGRGFISKGPVATTTGWECRFNSSNFFRFEWTASFLVGTTTITSNTWVHVAVVRSGSATGNIKTYVNGTLDATSGVAVTDNFIQTDPLRIGIDRAGTAFFPGYVDDLRITKYARYTANFTPSTSTFLDQ